MSYFLPYGHSKNYIKIDLDLYNYAAKSDLKNAAVLIHYNLLKILI